MTTTPTTETPTQTDMTEDVFACLQDAVNFARNIPCRTVDALKNRLKLAGWDDETIVQALVFWGQYERDKGAR